VAGGTIPPAQLAGLLQLPLPVKEKLVTTAAATNLSGSIPAEITAQLPPSTGHH